MSSPRGSPPPDIDAIFKALSRRLPGLIREAIALQAAAAGAADHRQIHRAPSSARWSVEVMKAIGFPFDRGRLDESEHPFTEGVPGDIRVTTRFDAADPFTGLLGAMHETGHAMYDLGLPQQLARPAGRPRSRHGARGEPVAAARDDRRAAAARSCTTCGRCWTSTSRSAARSGSRTTSTAISRCVRRGLIRVDADELTYPLHVLLRYELEKRLLSGELAVRDLPEAWNAGMEQRLGSRPENAAEGCLQDIHWALGSFGYFPSYALGAVIAAQLWESLRNQLPELEQQIAARRVQRPVRPGCARTCMDSARKVTVKELMKEATGQPLSANALLRYLEHKYLRGAT